MKIKLPKDLKGTQVARLVPFELNNFDIDLFLPTLFYKILAEGRTRARRTNDPTAIGRYLDQLAQHPSLENFDTPEGRRVLARLVRTSLVVTGGVGRAHRGEQILSIVPYSLLAHKAGFPTESRRQRGVDGFIYQALQEAIGEDKHDRILRSHFERVFGKGISLGALPELGGTYDGVTNLDTLTRLSLALLDTLGNTPAGQKLGERKTPHAFPGLTRELGLDLLRYLFAYHEAMPSQALTYHLLALINFELFVYTLKVAHATNQLVSNPAEMPAAMTATPSASPPPLYVDFTNVAGGLSQEMARAGVRRDLEAYQQFLFSSLLLRQLDRYAAALRRQPRRRQQLEDLLADQEGASYLQNLLLLYQTADLGQAIDASARLDEDRIRQENSEEEEGEESPILKRFDQITDPMNTDVERVVALLAEAQRQSTLGSFMKWYWGVGGLTKPHGLLAGTPGNRNSWRYAPSNDLLVVWVQLAAARLLKKEKGKPAAPRTIGLQAFLGFLESHFGIIVDRPPEPFTGADYTAAARENLRVMLRRLQQMGIFRDLSDDFTVQRLHPLYAPE